MAWAGGGPALSRRFCKLSSRGGTRYILKKHRLPCRRNHYCCSGVSGHGLGRQNKVFKSANCFNVFVDGPQITRDQPGPPATQLFSLLVRAHSDKPIALINVRDCSVHLFLSVFCWCQLITGNSSSPHTPTKQTQKSPTSLFPRPSIFSIRSIKTKHRRKKSLSR